MRVFGRSRWWIVLASTMALTCGAGAVNILAFGVFLKPLTEDLGFSRGAIGQVMAITTWLSVIGTPILGVLLDRYGARRVLLVGAPLFALATMAQSLMTSSLLVLYALFTLKSALSPGVSPTSIGFAVAQWFDRQRGLALGIGMSGVGLGTFIFPPAVAWMIVNYGWREAFVGMGLMMICLSFVPTLLWQRAPTEAEKAANPDIPQGEKAGLTLRQAVASWRFWALGLSFIVGIVGINGALTQIVVILTDRGAPLAEASKVLAASGVASIAGRLASGWLADRVWGSFVIVGFFILCVIGIALIGSGWSEPAPFIGTMCVGAALGCEIDMQTFLVSRYFGLKNLGKIGGLMFGSVAGATGLGGYVSGVAYDHWHSYTYAFIGYGIGLSLACVVLLCLGPYPFPALRHGAPKQGSSS
jgi:predicted MFS family arabinose efflux permease